MKKRGKAIGIISTLAIVAIVGSATTNRFNSKANEMQQKNVTNEVFSNDCKNFINENYRIPSIPISITSLDDLYNEFNMYESVDENVRKEILAKASDDVLIKFLIKEQTECLSLYENSTSLNAVKDVEKSDYVKSVNTEYFKKDLDSYKETSTIITKYGLKITMETIDEAEDAVKTRGTWNKVGKKLSENVTKGYGDRCFSYSFKGELICKIKGTFAYTISKGTLKTRYISGETENYVTPVQKIDVQKELITKDSAKKVNENIHGHIKFKVNATPALFGGHEVGEYKVNMVVTIKKDNPTKKQMTVNQYAQFYNKWYSMF